VVDTAARRLALTTPDPTWFTLFLPARAEQEPISGDPRNQRLVRPAGDGGLIFAVD
jgi:hypothetical protein